MKKIIYLLIFMITTSCGTIQKKNIKEEIIWVNSAKIPCKEVSENNCLEIQRGEKLNSKKWKLFYDKIEGFNFEPGNIYRLKVKTEKINIKEISNKKSSVKYTLVKIISKKSDATLRLHNIWGATSLNGKELKFKDEENRPVLELKITERKIYGKGTCNTFFGTILKVSETELEISDKIGSTMMACPKMELESAFLGALPKVKKYKIANNHLILFDDKNNEILQFKKID